MGWDGVILRIELGVSECFQTDGLTYFQNHSAATKTAM